MTMPAILRDPNVFAADQVPGNGAFARLWAAVAGRRQRQILHRQYSYLLECDEHILNDVGLTREGVRKAMAGSWGTADPGWRACRAFRTAPAPRARAAAQRSPARSGRCGR